MWDLIASNLNDKQHFSDHAMQAKHRNEHHPPLIHMLAVSVGTIERLVLRQFPRRSKPVLLADHRGSWWFVLECEVLGGE